VDKSHLPETCSGTAAYFVVFMYLFIQQVVIFTFRHLKEKGKAVPLQAWSDPEGSRKLRFPDFVITAQDGVRLSALRTGRLYPQKILLVLVSVRC